MYCTLNIIRQIKLRAKMLVRYVACMGEKRKPCSVLTGKPEGKGPGRIFSDRGVILKWSLRETRRERFD